MSNDLITWKEEPAASETWDDILGTVNEDEAYAYHRAAVIEAQKQASESELYTVSESELLERWQKAANDLEAATLEQKQIDTVHRFIQATPELQLNLKNQRRIDAYLKVAKLDASDPSHFDQAYRALAARNLLDLDESKRVREPFVRHTPEQLETMPLEKIEALARQSR
jgi:hypothetical protein